MIRPTRYTYSLIEESGAFTINVPTSSMNDVLNFCGSKSGRDVDKIRTLGLSYFPARTVNSIVLNKCAFFYECRVIGKCDITPDMLAEDVLFNHYTAETHKKNYHRIYIGGDIYAEVTLCWRKGEFIPFEWTFPDYRTAEYHEILKKIRALYTQERS